MKRFRDTYDFAGKAKRARVAKRKRVVYSARREEKKGVDTLTNIAGVISTTTTAANAFTLNLIELGTGSFNRVGRKVFLESVRLKGTVEVIWDLDAAAVSNSTTRMVLVWDKQPSGSAPTWDQMFGSTTLDGTESSGILDNLSFDNMSRFAVLKDCVWDITPQATAVGSTSVNAHTIHYDEYISLKGKETVYSGGSDPAVVGDISTGAVYLFYRTCPVDAGTTVNVTNGVARLRYTD